MAYSFWLVGVCIWLGGFDDDRMSTNTIAIFLPSRFDHALYIVVPLPDTNMPFALNPASDLNQRAHSRLSIEHYCT